MEAVLEIVVHCTERSTSNVNGHLYNARYVEYLEWGWEMWFKANGFSYARLLSLKAITVVVNLNLNLRHPCYLGDRLRPADDFLDARTRCLLAPDRNGAGPEKPACDPESIAAVRFRVRVPDLG